MAAFFSSHSSTETIDEGVTEQVCVSLTVPQNGTVELTTTITGTLTRG